MYTIHSSINRLGIASKPNEGKLRLLYECSPIESIQKHDA